MPAKAKVTRRNSSMLQQVSRWLLVLHGFANILMGSSSILRPQSFAEQAGMGPATDKALQSIGLGALGVGLYGAFGALSNDRRFFQLTIFMRLTFGIIALCIWDVQENLAVIAYEWTVAGLAAVAAFG